MKIWVVTGNSESSDKYGPFLFSKKPTKATLKKLIEYCGDYGEWDGPGDFGSYIYLDVNEVEVDERL